jgi:tRNA modification GTPase
VPSNVANIRELTCMACLTPRATGGIATIGVRGPRQDELIAGLFQPRGAAGGKVSLGRFGDDQQDDVVLVRCSDHLELNCHGGIAVVQWVLELLGARGAIEITWQDWVRLSSVDPVQAAAEIALPDALTSRIASILLDQYHGALGRALTSIVDQLARRDRIAARAALGELAARGALGRHLTQPWRVVLAGEPNVGKSSLINAILGYQRSITSPLPGTTRDAVTGLTAVEGWPIEFTDTAGIRAAATGLEAAGIVRTERAAASADLILWVQDQSVSPTVECPAAGGLLVVNKIDLPPVWTPGGLRVSARSGVGVAELLQAVARRLIPNPPPPGAAVPFSEELCSRVEEASRLADSDDLEHAIRVLRPLLVPCEHGSPRVQ